MEKRDYPQEFSPTLKGFLWVMLIYSLVVVGHNVMVGIEHPYVGIEMLCILLQVTLNIADIIGLVLIMRKRNIGVWIVVATGFFSILLSLAYPLFMETSMKYLSLGLKLVLLLLLNLKRTNLSAYQVLGLSKIEGHFIDEWKEGRQRYY